MKHKFNINDVVIVTDVGIMRTTRIGIIKEDNTNNILKYEYKSPMYRVDFLDTRPLNYVYKPSRWFAEEKLKYINKKDCSKLLGLL